MRQNIILSKEQPITPPTPVHVSERIWSHAYYDSKTIESSFDFAVPVAIASSIIVVSAISDMGTAQEAVQNGITAGFTASSAYLGRTIYEARKKLDFMRRNFDEAAQSFNRIDQAATQKLKKSLHFHRPSIPDMFDFKKYPLRTTVALSFAGAAAMVQTGQESLIAMGTTFFLMGVIAHEHTNNKNISTQARKATKFLQVTNQMRVAGFTIE